MDYQHWYIIFITIMSNLNSSEKCIILFLFDMTYVVDNTLNKWTTPANKSDNCILSILWRIKTSHHRGIFRCADGTQCCVFRPKITTQTKETPIMCKSVYIWNKIVFGPDGHKNRPKYCIIHPPHNILAHYELRKQ